MPAEPPSFEVTNLVTRSNTSFERVRDDFVIEEGQKVGIGVYLRQGFTVDKEKAGVKFTGMAHVTEKEILDAYGEPGMVHIYTGEIVKVFPEHFEHNINTFKGCSGAIVFLLDKKQTASSVKPCDYGRALGVHAGGHYDFSKSVNVGVPFSAKEPPEPFSFNAQPTGT